jgi:hypothetical protein
MNDAQPSPQRTLAFDAGDSVIDSLDLLFIEQHISENHPFAQSGFLQRVRSDAPLLPSDTEPSRVAVSDGNRSIIATGPGWMLCALRWSNGNAASR